MIYEEAGIRLFFLEVLFLKKSKVRDSDRTKIIKRASLVGIVGNMFLAVIKIVTGVLTGSMAVLGDGIDSSTDIVTSLISFFTANIIAKPPDRVHPYGHARAETIATKVLSFVIFFAGVQLAYTSVQKLLIPEEITIPGIMAIWVTLISIAGKLFLAFYKFNTGRKTSSLMLIADAKNMRNDVVISVTVLIGLFVTINFNFGLFDVITGLIVSVWILKVAWEIFKETSLELMEGIDDDNVYSQLFAAVDNIENAFNPHRARIRKLGSLYVIDLDIEVEGRKTVTEAHEICKRLEKEIKLKIENVYDIIVHVEPLGNEEEEEKYGRSKKSGTI